MIRKYLLSLVVVALVLPATADARTCLDSYYTCLNDTWNTKGLARVLADLWCGGSYLNCLRNEVR